LKWYRKKEYANGYEEAVNKRLVQPLPASSSSECSPEKIRDEEVAAATLSGGN